MNAQLQEPSSPTVDFDGATSGRMECGICWHVYDPSEGDEVWQIAAGTPFESLPEHWRCPVCDGPKEKFLLIGGAALRSDANADEQFATRLAAIERAYRASDARMRGLPVYNAKLTLELIGFRRFGADIVGVVATPWFIGVLALPLDPAQAPNFAEGAKRTRVFPSGAYEFIAGRLDGVGVIESLSLFSPVFEFDDPQVARIAAEAAADGLFEADNPAIEAVATPKSDVGVENLSRRAFFAARAD
jgi:[NiFe] hydrogenase assembly HybE family chaperone